MEELKKCPFCGGDVKAVTYDDDGFLRVLDSDDIEEDTAPCFIHCYNCDMEYFPCDDRCADVISAWNKRAGD
ncbi:Lar family restriction alleviation protein [Anaerotignum sp.]|uniref:Lar family restriction alleviation protein n=1 Tax=Anaerotignum sp. TaxID=2039241 RepID=UPI002714A8A1|nr:Lar family restriction alleviation protein [Anaerotignum sp.]